MWSIDIYEKRTISLPMSKQMIQTHIMVVVLPFKARFQFSRAII